MTFIEFIEIKKQTLDREWPNQFSDAKSDLLYHAFKAVTQDQGLNLLLNVLATSKTAPTVQAIIKKLEQRDFRPPETVHPLPTCETCNTTGVIFVNENEETLAMRCDKCENHNYFDLPKYTATLRQVCNPYNQVDKSNWKAVVLGYRNHMRYSSNYWKEQHVQKNTEVRTEESKP